jgi:uncharacterized protein YutE (UPF0331/DUF86 family)
LKQENVIRRKLVCLVEYVNELKPLLDYSYDQYESNYFIRRTGERLIQLIVENMVDINSIIISQKNCPPPKDYYSSFEQLGLLGILSRDFASSLAPCTGMRNRLVHEYDRIDDQIVFDSIGKLLEMVNQYIGFIHDFFDA